MDIHIVCVWCGGCVCVFNIYKEEIELSLKEKNGNTNKKKEEVEEITESFSIKLRIIYVYLLVTVTDTYDRMYEMESVGTHRVYHHQNVIYILQQRRIMTTELVRLNVD